VSGAVAVGTALSPNADYLARLYVPAGDPPVDRVDLELALVALDDDRVEAASLAVGEHDVSRTNSA
jgi:hypothetical protein